MLKTMLRSDAKDHVYRKVLADALKLAWRERRFWPLAFFASALLTMGSYDVILASVDAVSVRTSAFFGGTAGAFLGSSLQGIFGGAGGLLGVLTGFQVLALSSVILLALGALSCVCQGGLVFALGSWHRGDHPTVREALRVGAAALWPVIALNALSLMTLWILRFLAAFALALVLGIGSTASWYIYQLSYILFLGLSFVVAIVQIFALNALILQGAPIGEAIVRGYELFKKHWLITLETALLLFVSVSLLTVAFGFLAAVLFVPFTVSVVASAVLGSNGLFHVLMGGGFALLMLGAFSIAAFVTQVQYATWTLLYRRLGEGGVVPKLHRLYRNLTGTYKVPQS